MELPAPLPAVSALSAADSAIPPGSRPAEAAVDFAPASTPLDARLPQPRALSVAEPAVDRPRPDAGSTQPDTGIPMDANIDPITAQLAPARSGSADVVPSGSTLARPSRPADSKAVRADLPAVELNGPPAPHAPPLPVPAQRPWPARPEPSLGEPDPLSNAITPEPAAGTGSLPADRLLVAAMVTSPPVDQPEPAAGSTLAAVTPLRDLPPRELSFSGSPPVAEVPPVPAVMQLPLPAVSAAGPAPVVAESALRPVGAPSVQSAGPADLPPGQIAARGHVSVAPLAQSAPAGGSLVETATASEVRWQPASAPQRSAALMQPLEPELPLLEEQSYAAEPGEAPSLAVSAVGRARLAARRADMPAESPVPAPPVIIAPAEPDANQAAAPTLAARLTPREADDSRVASLATGPAAPAAPGPAPLPSPPVDDVARPGTAVDRDPPPAAGPLAVPGLAPRDIEVAVPDSPRQQLAPLAPQEERLPEDTSLAATVTIDRELEAVQAAPVSASTTLPLPPLRLPEMRVPQETVPPDSPLAGRSPEVRKELITRMGGSDETEAAVALALDWLGRHQSPDGRWDSDEFDDGCGRCGSGTHIEADVALTGLAVLSFLAADHTHFKKGPYQERVDRALRWLISQQGRDGDLRGGETMYSHGIATIALAEGLAMTADDRLVQPVHRAVFFIYAARNLDVGGWRYDPGQPGDTSVLGWQIMALKSAERAGMEIPAGCYETGQRWLQRVAEQPGSGLYSYRPGRRPTPAMTAEAMYTLQLMGARRDEPRMRLSAAYLTQNLPDWDEANTYYWYYATLALHQHQGRSWQRWNEEMKRELIGNQVRDGSPAGSWPPTDRWAAVGGRVYQTALCALMLESYYRYLPMYASEEEQR
jgi:hypothetical protein